MTEIKPKNLIARVRSLFPTLAVAAALIAVPTLVPMAPAGLDGGAYAKSGKGGNSGNGGQKSKGQGGSKKAAKQSTKQASLTSDDLSGSSLKPSEKGKWNAANANQAALDAHIRNQNFNGTIGALAQFQLAAKAAAGEALTEDEAAALETFIDDSQTDVTDQDLADFLNAGAVEGDPVLSVEDGLVSCTANCDGVDLAQAQSDADAEAARLQEAAAEAALDDFLTASEERIISESNKTLSSERTEDLLNELAGQLGVERAAPVTDETEVALAIDVVDAGVQ